MYFYSFIGKFSSCFFLLYAEFVRGDTATRADPCVTIEKKKKKFYSDKIFFFFNVRGNQYFMSVCVLYCVCVLLYSKLTHNMFVANDV